MALGPTSVEQQSLFWRVRELQQRSPTLRAAWHEYCDSKGDGKRDPRKHGIEFLRAFVDAWNDVETDEHQTGGNRRRNPRRKGQQVEKASGRATIRDDSFAVGTQRPDAASDAEHCEDSHPCLSSTEALAQQAQRLPIAKRDPELLGRALEVIRRWEERFPRDVWNRMTKMGKGGSRRVPKVLKELNEVAPVIRKVEKWLAALPVDAPPAGIVDLCSGFGFLGMFLAELLPCPERLTAIILVDRDWPNAKIGSAGKISTEHIYECGDWRVPLQTIKSDIKDVSNTKLLVSRLIGWNDRPCILCAVHLCGTLALRAAQLFNASTRAHALALVPCCMPPKPNGKAENVYSLGSHTFSSADFRDRAVLPTPATRFRAWVEHVVLTLAPGEDGQARLEEIGVNTNKGSRHDFEEAYLQNLYIFAQRGAWASNGSRPPIDDEVQAAGGRVCFESREQIGVGEAPTARGAASPPSGPIT